MARAAAAARLLQFPTGVIQDLERGNCGGQYLHVTAGGRDDGAGRGAGGRVQAVAPRRHATHRRGGGLRHRRPRECAAARRIAAQHPSACHGAGQAFRAAPRNTHAARPLRRPGDRHPRRRGRVAADHHGGDAAAGAVPLRNRAVRRSCSGGDRVAGSGGCVVQRRQWLACLQAPCQPVFAEQIRAELAKTPSFRSASP
jgi:hypothetical protein